MTDITHRVSAIMVTCGVDERWRECLRSLAAQIKAPAEIIVIDNSARNDCALAIRKEFPSVLVYYSARNLGYGNALNIGIAMSSGEFTFCLNDDVVLDGNFIKEALQGFARDEKVGMVSGKILRADAKTIDSCGLGLSVWRTAKERGYGLIDKGQFEKEGYVFGVSGSAAFYRRKMLDDLRSPSSLGSLREQGAYFDPRFFMFYEDLDIAWRAQRKGWKAYYIPAAIAFHVRGLSARERGGIDKPFARRYLSDELQAELMRNRYRAMAKNETVVSAIIHLPCVIFYDILAWGYTLFARPRVLAHFFFPSSKKK